MSDTMLAVVKAKAAPGAEIAKSKFPRSDGTTFW
jgi:hypothetical protein